MPRSWAACMARASVSAISAARRGVGRSRAIQAASVPPAMYSIVKYGRPSVWPISKICTTCGCCSRATASASASKRAECLGLARRAAIILMATVRCKRVCTAR